MNLPIDILHNIMQYLSECDRISLCLSKVSDLFTQFYGRRRNISLGHCTNISPCLLREIPACSVFKEAVRSLDLSHCFYLPLDLLISTITQLLELEELYVHDTQLQLKDVGKIFQHCPNITKLSISLITKPDHIAKEIEGNSYVNILHPYECKFSQLTFLKLEVINMAPRCFWLELYQVLGWCQNCTSLELVIFSTDIYLEEIRHENRVQRAMLFSHSLFPKLKWMGNLNTFIVMKRGSPEYRDLVLEQFFDWLFREVTFTALEHLWISCAEENITFNTQFPRSLKTLMASLPIREFHRDCPFLTRIGRAKLATLRRLVHLRDVTGVYSSDEEFDEFIRWHPLIEHLSIKFNGAPYFPEAFELPNLRTLKYESTLYSPDVDIMRTVVDACPNIEELYLSHSSAGSSAVLSHLYRLKRLKKLVVNGDEYDADVFRQIFTKCKRLERLHLTLHFDPSVTGSLINLDQLRFQEDLQAEEPVVRVAAGPAGNGCLMEGVERAHVLTQLFSVLPLATALRDIRLHVRVCVRVRLEEFLAAVQHCSLLERLMIIKDEDRRSFQMIYFMNYGDSWNPLDSEAVIRYVSSAQRLIALCLVDEYFSQTAILDVSRRLKQEIVPQRPAFWFHIGLQMPSCVDDTVPRNYYKQLIRPLDGYSVPYNV